MGKMSSIYYDFAFSYVLSYLEASSVTAVEQHS
jgi:hypothetical protein